MLPLSKVMHPDDLTQPDLVEHVWTVKNQDLTGQADCRVWEYAQALRAFEQWGGQPTHHCVDVGGAGSPFWRMLGVDNAFVIDPKEGPDLATYVRQERRTFDAVFCLSVIEHVEDLDQFLYHLSCLVAPGGLLVLTTDIRENSTNRDLRPVDDRHYHWMRQRIFTPDVIYIDVLAPLTYHSFSLLGAADLQYTQHMENWGFSVCSLALQKRA